MKNEHKFRSEIAPPGPGASEEDIIAWWLDDLARAYALVSTRAREVRDCVVSDGLPASGETRSALKRLTDAICRVQRIVFADLQESSSGETL